MQAPTPVPVPLSHHPQAGLLRHPVKKINQHVEKLNAHLNLPKFQQT